jgi:hypothetical protein
MTRPTPIRTDTVMTRPERTPREPVRVAPARGGRPAPDPDPTEQHIEIFGNRVKRAHVAAVYIADPDHWTDMPEAFPRARCGVVDNPEPGADRHVYVMIDGTYRFDKAVVRVDEYTDPPQ